MARHQAFRIVSIENPAEVHVRDGQLVVAQDKGTASIPVSDILVLVVCGPNIRMSTMAQTMLANNKVVILYLGRNHHPAAMLLPMSGNVRQARIAQAQASLAAPLKADLWRRIIAQKIENQGTALAILGLEGAEELWACSREVLPADADNREGFAAKRYFQHLQPGLNRRVDDPLNSVLNYGYAIVRAVMAREVVCAGLLPALGLHHCSQLNPFNLVDDLMEPLRPSIDLLAVGVAGRSVRLSRKQRAQLREAPALAVSLNGATVSIAQSARATAQSLGAALVHADASALALPATLPTDFLSAIEE